MQVVLYKFAQESPVHQRISPISKRAVRGLSKKRGILMRRQTTCALSSRELPEKEGAVHRSLCTKEPYTQGKRSDLQVFLTKRALYSRGGGVPPVQGGENPCDALSCRSFSAKEQIIVGLFCRK